MGYYTRVGKDSLCNPQGYIFDLLIISRAHEIRHLKAAMQDEKIFERDLNTLDNLRY
jgi:hypothetical protein